MEQHFPEFPLHFFILLLLLLLLLLILLLLLLINIHTIIITYKILLYSDICNLQLKLPTNNVTNN